MQVNQRAFVAVTLELGPVTEEVIVRAPAPVVDGYSSTVGTVIDNHKLVDLPLNGRDFFQLSTLVTGALPAAEGSQNANEGGAVSLNGAREQSNNFLLDGVDNNNLVMNQVVIHPSVDAVEEFKVQSSSYSAEFGRSGGAQFNFVTRSGTNAYSGSALRVSPQCRARCARIPSTIPRRPFHSSSATCLVEPLPVHSVAIARSSSSTMRDCACGRP